MGEGSKMTMVGENESPQMLSARLGVPLCMLLRANRLVCAAWLLPGREIMIPEMGFCENDAFPCPAGIFRLPARDKTAEVCITGQRDEVGDIAHAMGTAERLVLLARGRKGPLREGERILLDSAVCKKKVGTVLPGETIGAFSKRYNIRNDQELQQLNRIGSGDIWPGMRLILPDDGEV